MARKAPLYGDIDYAAKAEHALVEKAKSSWLPKLMDFDLAT